MPTGQSRGKTKCKVWVQRGKIGLVVERVRKKENQNIISTLHIYIYTLSHTHTHTHKRAHTHTENLAEVLKSPQCTLFICFLFPCYIITATTTVIAAGGTGSVSSITQRCWHSCCTGSRSPCGVTSVLLWLWAIIGVRRSPGCPARPTHGVDFCKQTSTGLVFCIVL